jgi:very-short-patch-repair endonuclease
MNYPMVFYPKAIADFCRQYPLGLSRENKVSLQPAGCEPAILKPKHPKSPVVLSVKWLGLIWLLWLGGAIALALFAISWGWLWGELLLLVGGYSCLVAAAYTYVLGDRQKLLSQYKRQVLEYQEQLGKYQEKRSLSVFQPESQPLSLDPQFQLQWRCQALADLMSSRVSPIGRSNARQGVSEAEFLRQLQCYFPMTVQGVEFKIPMSKKCYSADFIIVHSTSGIGIDVEVDEPYAGFSKKPTHCWDDDSDRRRNQLFNEWGWIVVRFTEKQVVQAPLSCCKFIAQVIFEVTGELSYLQLLKAEPDLLPVKPWTAKEARRMAKDGYRQSYLPVTRKE